MTPHKEFEKRYRPSATVIIAAFDPVQELGYDYKILLAKRTEATAYAPDHHVFPGGVFDSQADESQDWLQHFHDFGVNWRNLDALCLEKLPNRPTPIMTNGKNFSRDISLRITSIREVFEEVGLLLCLCREQLQKPHTGTGTLKLNFDRGYWQRRIHNNSREFLSLCRHLEVIPDVWALHEWSIWRSPPTSSKRYDTAIYVVALEQQPAVLLEPSEVESELWVTPAQALKVFKNRKIWLPPMQVYEIARLTNASSWCELKNFALTRSTKGCTLLMMAYYRCDDALVGTLPYDDFYPDTPLEYTETRQFQGTSSELEAKSKNLHRVICRDMYDSRIVCNIPPLDGHLCPTPRFSKERSLCKL